MKTDKLEEFVKKNRGEFDDAMPDPAIWSRISEDLGKPGIRSIRRPAWLAKAAMIVAIFGASYLVHEAIDRYYKPADTAGNQAQTQYSPEVEELIEAEGYYSAQIDEKKNTLTALASDNPAMVRDIDTEINQLDSIYVQLKRDLRDNAQNEAVIEAMIQNYRIRIEILDDVLYQLKKSKGISTDEEEKENIRI
jgi:hypothetical protein